MQFRDVKLKRGFRFVESEPNLATAGGLTSGIDLALRVVERYLGRASAEGTAYFMEYQGEGWKDSTGAANQAYAKPSNPGSRTACRVCGMTLSSAAPLKSAHKGSSIISAASAAKGSSNFHLPISSAEKG